MLLLATDCLERYGLNRIFQIAREANYDGIELVISPIVDTQDLSYVRKLSKSFELPVVAVSTPKKNVTKKKIKLALDMAKALNSKVVTIYPPSILDFEFGRWIKKSVPLLRSKYRIIIALNNAPAENLFGFLPQYFLNSIAAQKQFRYASFDTSNIYTHRQDLLSAAEELKRNIVHVHLSNVKEGKKHYFPDDGILPLESFLKKLRLNGYEGAISLRVAPKYFPIGENDKVIDLLKKSRSFYEKYFLKKK